jgi:hypothetical protein
MSPQSAPSKTLSFDSNAECQKKAWAEGHNVNCEERRQFWKGVKMCRPPVTKERAK